jgi:hypothetical protein
MRERALIYETASSDQRRNRKKEPIVTPARILTVHKHGDEALQIVYVAALSCSEPKRASASSLVVFAVEN